MGIVSHVFGEVAFGVTRLSNWLENKPGQPEAKSESEQYVYDCHIEFLFA